MAEVAETAKMTRQAVYLHFETRTALMIALMDHVGESLGGPELFRKVEEAPTALAALQAAMRAMSRYAAKIHHVASALDRARHSDEAAAAAWNDRMNRRRKGIGRTIGQLESEGALAKHWTARRVVDAVVALTSPHLYAELVEERHWSAKEYEAFLFATVGAMLRRPIG